MRRPTDDQYEWHRRALAGENPPVTYEPQPGFYLRKDALINGMTPCQIWLEQPIDEETGELLGDEILVCECGGVPCDATEAWTWLAKRPIPKDEFHLRMAALMTGEEITEAF